MNEAEDRQHAAIAIFPQRRRGIEDERGGNRYVCLFENKHGSCYVEVNDSRLNLHRSSLYI